MATKKKSTTKRKPVPRHTRKYQFRNDHPVDQHVEEILDFWKRGKKEITNLRKAVALYYALEQGDLPILWDMFPQYKSQFAPGTADAIKQFMEILTEQQHQIESGAGQTPKYIPPIPLPAPPVAEVKQSTAPVSVESIVDNFLSAFQ